MVPRKPRGGQSAGISHAPLTARLGFRYRGARHIVSLVLARWRCLLLACQKGVINLEPCLGARLILEAYEGPEDPDPCSRCKQGELSSKAENSRCLSRAARKLRSAGPSADGCNRLAGRGQGTLRTLPTGCPSRDQARPSTAQRFGLDNGRENGTAPDPCSPRRLGEICYWPEGPQHAGQNRSLGSAAGPVHNEPGARCRSTALHCGRVAGGSACNFV